MKILCLASLSFPTLSNFSYLHKVTQIRNCDIVPWYTLKELKKFHSINFNQKFYIWCYRIIKRTLNSNSLLHISLPALVSLSSPTSCPTHHYLHLRESNSSNEESTKLGILGWGRTKHFPPALRLSKVSHLMEWALKSQLMYQT